MSEDDPRTTAGIICQQKCVDFHQVTEKTWQTYEAKNMYILEQSTLYR